MKLALFSVSYAGFWGQDQLSLEEFIPRAKPLGYDGVEIMGKRPHAFPADMSSDRIRRIRKLLKNSRLDLLCMAAYTNFTAGAESREVPLLDMQVEYVGQLARITRELGGNLVRIFTGYEVPGPSFGEQWNQCIRGIRACCDAAAKYDVRIGVQNHHDIGVETDGLMELIGEADRKNVFPMFDAWSPFLRGEDLVKAAQKMGALAIYTTVADYVTIPLYRYNPSLVNYEKVGPAMVKAVPMGDGVINYRDFLKAMRDAGYKGPVCYEMCSPLRGGGSLQNLDDYAKQFAAYMRKIGMV